MKSFLGFSSLLLLASAACGSVVQTPNPMVQDTDAGTTGDTPPPPPEAHIVFVTSTVSDGNMGGLQGADAICQSLADNAGLGGVYLAWLADATKAPGARMNHHDGPYTLTDGTQIARDWDDLVDGGLDHTVDRDERNVPALGTFICRGGEVWSNVEASGERRQVEACSNWNDASSTNTGTSGNVTNADAAWTEGECMPINCGSQLPFYCVQQ